MISNGFKLRSNVDDFAVWQNVVAANEYGLPLKIQRESIILDVGAHIGCFALAAYERGARRIFCYEADHENYLQLLENIESFEFKKEIFTYNAAVWRSDTEMKDLGFMPSELAKVGGGGNVFFNSTKRVRAISFDAIMDEIGERVFIAKFDCEGSEWPIFLTSARLHMVEWIVGEYHEIGGPNMKYVRDDQIHPTEIPENAKIPGWSAYTAAGLKGFLEDQGFNTAIQPSARLPWLGKFVAVRR